jgi:hypothetical protein
LDEFLAELRDHGLLDETGTDLGPRKFQTTDSNNPARQAIEVAEAVECSDIGIASSPNVKCENGAALSIQGLRSTLEELLRRRMLQTTPLPLRRQLRSRRPQIPPPVFRRQDERAPQPPAAHCMGTPRKLVAGYRRRQKSADSAGAGSATTKATSRPDAANVEGGSPGRPGRYVWREPWRSPSVDRAGPPGSWGVAQASLSLLPLPTVRRL